LHETTCLKDLNVLHNRSKRHGQRLSQFADRSWTLAEPFQHKSAARIGERVKNAVQI
jgi:hypothetical protein